MFTRRIETSPLVGVPALGPEVLFPDFGRDRPPRMTGECQQAYQTAVVDLLQETLRRHPRAEIFLVGGKAWRLAGYEDKLRTASLLATVVEFNTEMAMSRCSQYAGVYREFKREFMSAVLRGLMPLWGDTDIQVTGVLPVEMMAIFLDQNGGREDFSTGDTGLKLAAELRACPLTHAHWDTRLMVTLGLPAAGFRDITMMQYCKTDFSVWEKSAVNIANTRVRVIAGGRGKSRIYLPCHSPQKVEVDSDVWSSGPSRLLTDILCLVKCRFSLGLPEMEAVGVAQELEKRLSPAVLEELPFWSGGHKETLAMSLVKLARVVHPAALLATILPQSVLEGLSQNTRGQLATMGVNSGLSLLKVLRILDPERLLPESEQILRQLLARDFSKNVVADMTLYPSEIFAGSLCRLMQAVSGFEADALPVFLPYAALLNLFVVLGFGAKFWRAPR